jgi:hypothetical protein
MFFQVIARRCKHQIQIQKRMDTPDLRFAVFVINLLTTLGYREVDHGKGRFDEQTIQRSAGSVGSAAPNVGPLSFAKPPIAASRGVMVNVSKIRFKEVTAG